MSSVRANLDPILLRPRNSSRPRRRRGGQPQSRRVHGTRPSKTRSQTQMEPAAAERTSARNSKVDDQRAAQPFVRDSNSPPQLPSVVSAFDQVPKHTAIDEKVHATGLAGKKRPGLDPKQGKSTGRKGLFLEAAERGRPPHPECFGKREDTADGAAQPRSLSPSSNPPTGTGNEPTHEIKFDSVDAFTALAAIGRAETAPPRENLSADSTSLKAQRAFRIPT